ncbi:crossover junction endodeoxyribonuclease RuvC [bacterium]|nr:MAG: crossover junction endodeoxyribonuclease RuvC [bacterium]
MIILGIDPGIATTGFGVIRHEKGINKLVDCGVITTHKDLTHAQRLAVLYDDLQGLMQKHQPQEVAVEKLFFSTNVTTAMTVGEARGVVLLVLQQAGVAIFEYTPLQVKQGIAGYGKATKRQVQEMVKVRLKLSAIPKPDDAADALAIALMHTGHIKTPR